jgi:hypothetical protein
MLLRIFNEPSPCEVESVESANADSMVRTGDKVAPTDMAEEQTVGLLS